MTSLQSMRLEAPFLFLFRAGEPAKAVRPAAIGLSGHGLRPYN
jgi:hypothetical protein